MADTKIIVRMNGSYWVEGPFDLVDQEGNAFTIPEGERVALCRCGLSQTKPFCDLTHRNEGYLFDAPTKAT